MKMKISLEEEISLEEITKLQNFLLEQNLC